jgi:hypothetical protein
MYNGRFHIKCRWKKKFRSIRRFVVKDVSSFAVGSEPYARLRRSVSVSNPADISSEPDFSVSTGQLQRTHDHNGKPARRSDKRGSKECVET